MLSTEDRLDITQIINLYGHVIDNRQWDRLEEILTEDIAFDSTGTGGAVVSGLEALRDRWVKSRNHPLAHHAMNIVIWEDADGTVRAQSKGLGVGFKGRVGSLTYYDVLRKTPAGWRIAARRSQTMQPQPRPEAAED